MSANPFDPEVTEDAELDAPVADIAPAEEPSEPVADVAPVQSNEPKGDPAVVLPKGVNVVTAPPVNLKLPDPKAKGPWVKYVGPATLRILRAADWKSLGIDSTAYCEWNVLNKKRLPVSQFNTEQLHYLLQVDGRFELDESV